jgi:N-carbamoyl-L-amino-acid hydrolase
VKRNPSTKFEGLVASEIAAAAERLGLPSIRIPSGAGHDARYLASVCDSGMIFVPCEKGISHNELENAQPSDLKAGARVMTEVLVRLANR